MVLSLSAKLAWKAEAIATWRCDSRPVPNYREYRPRRATYNLEFGLGDRAGKRQLTNRRGGPHYRSLRQAIMMPPPGPRSSLALLCRRLSFMSPISVGPRGLAAAQGTKKIKRQCHRTATQMRRMPTCSPGASTGPNRIALGL